jgi:hypothetical protein
MSIGNTKPEQLVMGFGDKELATYYTRQRERLDNRVVLVDGGVANNLGTEGCYRSERQAFAIVSDARIPERTKVGVYDNWLSLTDRFVNLMYDRKERLIKRDQGHFTELQRALLSAQSEGERVKAVRKLNELPTFVSLDEDSALSQKERARRNEFRQDVRQGVEDIFRTQEKAGPQEASVVSRWRSTIKEISQLSIADAQMQDLRWSSMGNNAKQAAEAARIETRLQKLDTCMQEHIINVGYAMADAAIHSFWGKLFVEGGESSPTFPDSAWDAALIWLYGNPGLPYPVRPELWDESERRSVECKD